MLNLDDQEPRELGVIPSLIEVIGLLLLDQVVALNTEALGILGFESLIRRRGPEPPEVRRKVPVEHHQGIFCLGMLVKILRQEHVCTEVHVTPPECRQFFRLDPDVFDPFRVFGLLDLGDHLVHDQVQVHLALFRYGHPDRLAVKVARRAVPLLTFPIVHGKFHLVPGGEVESLVHVKQGLHIIITGLQFRQAFKGKSEGLLIHGDRFARGQGLHVHPEHGLGIETRIHLESRL